VYLRPTALQFPCKFFENTRDCSHRPLVSEEVIGPLVEVLSILELPEERCGEENRFAVFRPDATGSSTNLTTGTGKHPTTGAGSGSPLPQRTSLKCLKGLLRAQIEDLSYRQVRALAERRKL
jgi:hypothetical protein